MGNKIPSREEALNLLLKYNQSDSLIKHAKAVEGVMRYIACKLGEDEDLWGIVGLVHDLDYEMYPEQHCQVTKKILEEEGWDETLIRAILSHGWGTCTDVEPRSLMEKYLYAIDELTGLITAVALVRPSKSIMDVEVKSVKKKWKEKNFAAGANREIIQKGADLLGISLDELIQLTIEGMKTVAKEIGL
ncbi:MAG: HDIG domain-containing protein [Ignavibacteria bacterium]|nr:HDIG domain-containing protein [Ignavibacteria bacterium]